jgi:hypothetical protein
MKVVKFNENYYKFHEFLNQNFNDCLTSLNKSNNKNLINLLFSLFELDLSFDSSCGVDNDNCFHVF